MNKVSLKFSKETNSISLLNVTIPFPARVRKFHYPKNNLLELHCNDQFIRFKEIRIQHSFSAGKVSVLVTKHLSNPTTKHIYKIETSFILWV